ncbi:hypothetical protein RRG08_022962 [Elysia crispata]|uniref:Uncharacterized protein n=1 Tax=Elysia crispata TaxID=231223 RepID=A0AAE1AEI4_9GAST|nr:hypothetical protein RRG08_022962 [Elysia crispata]
MPLSTHPYCVSPSSSVSLILSPASLYSCHCRDILMVSLPHPVFLSFFLRLPCTHATVETSLWCLSLILCFSHSFSGFLVLMPLSRHPYGVSPSSSVSLILSPASLYSCDCRDILMVSLPHPLFLSFFLRLPCTHATVETSLWCLSLILCFSHSFSGFLVLMRLSRHPYGVSPSSCVSLILSPASLYSCHCRDILMVSLPHPLFLSFFLRLPCTHATVETSLWCLSLILCFSHSFSGFLVLMRLSRHPYGVSPSSSVSLILSPASLYSCHCRDILMVSLPHPLFLSFFLRLPCTHATVETSLWCLSLILCFSHSFSGFLVLMPLSRHPYEAPG